MNEFEEKATNFDATNTTIKTQTRSPTEDSNSNINYNGNSKCPEA